MAGTVAGQLAPRQSTTASTGDDTGDQLLNLFADPFQAALQTNAFWASLGIYIPLTILLGVVFSFIRPRHRLVYAPKSKHADEKHAPPPMGNGVLSWIGPVSKAKEDVLMDKIGMDAIVFLRFTRMLRNMFITLGLIGLCIMIPVNVTQGADYLKQGGSGFAIMTPQFVFGGGLWAQVVVAWATNIIVGYFLWHNYKRVHQLRRKYFESSEYQTSLHARTLLVRDIPRALRNSDGIVRITDKSNPTGVSPKVTVGRNVKLLPDLLEEHEESVRKMESVLAKYLKNPDRLPPTRPTMKASGKFQGQKTNGKVDAIDYLTDRIRELEAQIVEIRECVDTRDPEAYGFASWDQISQAHSVAFAARGKKHEGATVELAPRPNDIIWKNVSLNKGARRSKKFGNAIWISVLTILWIPLNVAIAVFLSNLSNLGSVWPAFNTQLQAHSTGWAFVQGIAAPALTSLVYLLLPIIFRRLQIRAGDFTKTEREHHVLRNLFDFFVINNLVFFSIFSAVWQYISAVIKNSRDGTNAWDSLREGKFFLLITTSLCQISPFWVSFIIQRNLGAAVDLVQLWKLFVTWYERKFMAPTPRQNIEWTAPQPFDYASYYNYFLFYATVALCFSTLQPIILLLTALYFAVDAVLKKYLLMYVFITKTESGGMSWRVVFNRLVFAVMLSDVVIGVVVKARGTWTMVAALAPLLVLMAALKWYCLRTFDANIKYYVRHGMHDEERPTNDHKRRRAEKISAKFGNPALSRPLMTPMVSAKARHVLAEIYRGRLDSDIGAAATGFSDIAMEDMWPSAKKPSVVNAPFEFVSEAQQDFAFYKNRDDFREEGGDMYGRPEDLATERSQTPLSMMSKGYGPSEGYMSPPYESREASPAPDPKRVSMIKRKEVDPSHVHPDFRMGRGPLLPRMDGTSDLGVQHGRYTDPYDDRTNLLGAAGDVPIPSGEFMSMDRFGTGTTTPASYRDHPGGSYDYFRSPQ